MKKLASLLTINGHVSTYGFSISTLAMFRTKIPIFWIAKSAKKKITRMKRKSNQRSYYKQNKSFLGTIQSRPSKRK